MTSPVSSLSEEKMDLSPTTEGMFGETFSSGNGDEIAVEPLENGTDGKSEDCKICEQKLTHPRVLSCLHVFCELCIDKLLMEGSEDSSKMSAVVKCPSCSQSTKVERNVASSLPSHFILTNILDLASIDISTLVCTSCKSKDKAISRCSDCANFLCLICDNAHRFMRCFEEHQVITLEVKGDDPTVDTVIHKPLYCNVHTSENLKYYCYTCEIPVCNDCLIVDHKATEHRYENISEAEKHLRNDVEKLLTDTKAKIDVCDQDASKLEASLQELQNQHDTARDVILNAYERFQSLIEKCKDKAMNDLKMVHTNREIQIMEQCHNVEKIVEQMEYSANFTRKLLDNGNGPEVLSLKKMVTLQLTRLIEHMPKIDVNCSLEFQTNFKKFEDIAQDLFGKFKAEKPSLSPKESTPPPTLPGMPPMLSIKNSTQNGSSNVSHSTLGSVTASSPISLPTSMQSSFDGDNSGNCYQSYMMQSDSPTPSLAQNVPAVSTISTPLPVSSMVEYNLHRLANLCENDMSDSILPQSSVSTSNSFTLNDMMSGDLMLNNLQALAKIGLNSNGGDISNGSMMSSSGHDNLSLMNDFGSLSNSTSPILPNNSGMNNDEMRISSFSQFAGSGVAGRSKATPMQIRTKFGSLGPTRGQFNSPHGFCLGLEEEIIVADTNNHRIEVFDSLGNFKFHFGVPGKEEGQLWFPRKVAVMRTNSKFVVCDRGNERSRMQIFTKNGHFIKKIAIRYIDIVAGLAVTNQGHIVAVDSVSPTVFIISEDGDLVHWFDCSDHMREPSDIAISGTDFYVCDFKGHCVAVFSEMGLFKCRIGSEKVTCFPNGIDISDAGDVLIGDSHGNRFHVACYNRNGILQSEYECPYVKVSRCCGLKITSEGLIVTLAKNNHHVLVLNTLYIQ